MRNRSRALQTQSPQPLRILQFELPGIPPSMNDYWRHDRGRTHISTEGREWREFVQILAPSECFEGKVFCDIGLYFPNNLSDCDNRIKSLQDSLQYAGIVKNDRQIRDTRAHELGIDRENPRTVITIGSLELRKAWIIEQVKVF